MIRSKCATVDLPLPIPPVSPTIISLFFGFELLTAGSSVGRNSGCFYAQFGTTGIEQYIRFGHFKNFPMDPANRNYLLTFGQSGTKLFSLLCLFGLRTNHKEVKNQNDRNPQKQECSPSAFFGSGH